MHKVSDGDFFFLQDEYYILAKKIGTGLDSAVDVEVGVEFTFVLHLPHVMLHHIWDYKVCSCQVIKVCIKVCCSLNMFLTASRHPDENL